MKRVLLSVMVLAGCSFHSNPGNNGGDDSGQPDAPTGTGSNAGGGGGDTDGDGVADATDNCPTVPNADQHDHDGDGRGDVCDVCPHIVDAGGDADGDGVGDACDPNPTTPGEHIALFEGFYADPGWHAVTGGAWTVDNGALHESDTTMQHQVVAGLDLHDVFVDARVKVNNVLQNSSTRRSVGLVIGYENLANYYFCGLAAPQNQPEVDAGVVYSGNFDYNQDAFATQMSGDWITLQARLSTPPNGTHFDCTGHRDQTTANASYDTEPANAGDFGLRTNGVDASFDYVFVVDVPQPND
ncbi:MAG TPA: thrombospondin type 3 repeat-containing protein [Kofleriaceae bacterium]|nr:thrombospondin type 3 repeat-containing protein [Kofleriaceae bacterium]